MYVTRIHLWYISDTIVCKYLIRGRQVYLFCYNLFKPVEHWYVMVAEHLFSQINKFKATVINDNTTDYTDDNAQYISEKVSVKGTMAIENIENKNIQVSIMDLFLTNNCRQSIGFHIQEHLTV